MSMKNIIGIYSIASGTITVLLAALATTLAINGDKASLNVSEPLLMIALGMSMIALSAITKGCK
jgi:hypothetical protein